MQIIIISRDNKKQRHFHLSRSQIVIFTSFFITLLLTLVVVFGKSLFENDNWEVKHQPIPPLQNLSQAEDFAPELTLVETPSDFNDFYAKRIGQLQAESIRLTAITEKLALLAGMDIDEFMGPQIAQGGVESLGEKLTIDHLNIELERVATDFRHHELQLDNLEDYMLTQTSIMATIPLGKPVASGWVSSLYGNRIDPFTHHRTFHKGIDFAGKKGSQILAPADGTVIEVKTHGSYGKFIELDHGNGYVTRYAHNDKLKVKVGDNVKKGQVIALMGSTGRSSATHLHYEVLLDGKQVNPKRFIQ